MGHPNTMGTLIIPVKLLGSQILSFQTLVGTSLLHLHCSLDKGSKILCQPRSQLVNTNLADVVLKKAFYMMLQVDTPCTRLSSAKILM